jgi:hypothetical protein
MADSDFWKDRQAEFEKYAKQFPTLVADWNAEYRIWNLCMPGLKREIIGGSVPDPFNVPRECTGLFDAIARKCLTGLPGRRIADDAEPSQLWLDLIRELGWGFLPTGSPVACTEQEWDAGVKDGKSLAQVRREQGFSTGDEGKKIYRRTKNGKLRRLSARELRGKSSDDLQKYYHWLQNGTIEGVFQTSAHICEGLAADAFELKAKGEHEDQVSASPEMPKQRDLPDDADFWRARRAEFDALLTRQRAVLRQETHKLWLQGSCRFLEKDGMFGSCSREGGYDGTFISDFEDVATRAACALGCPLDVDAVPFWICCLAKDLLSARESVIRYEFSGDDSVGRIQGLSESSIGYCSRLAAATEMQARLTSKSGGGPHVQLVDPPPAPLEASKIGGKMQQAMGTVAIFTDPRYPPPDIWQEAYALI